MGRLAAAALAHAAALAAAAAPAPAFPPTVLYNASLFPVTRARIAAGDPSVTPAYGALLQAADAALSQGPWTVTAKAQTPPSGDKHDYMSISKYFWPCNANPCNATPPAGGCGADGLPWVMCDGLVNGPAVADGDLPRVSAMCAAVEALGSAYLWSGNATYARRAAEVLRVWFVDPATRMNPNGDFMQRVPGVNNGSSWGVIEVSVCLSDLLDRVGFIAPSGAWGADDQAALLGWVAAWDAWLRTSPLPRAEAQASNNHQTYFSVMALSTALWLGNATRAAGLVAGALEPPPAGNPNAPIGAQIWRDGELPAEEARTNSVGYVAMDLLGLLRLGLASRLPAVAAAGAPDALAYVSRANGSSIRGAVDYMAPFVTGAAPWPHANIDNASWAGFAEVFARAAHAGWPAGGAYYAALAAATGAADTDVSRLFWPWPPAPAPGE